ncbi:hypothetical protein JDS76_26155 [Bacillus cereus]|uniref:hypothetical protein n=1 Tax=Bacillus cereus TaxID=1396 RepID=UPI000279AE8A|nr:hypothetical protein [Bacillus cereus]EJR71386.1 hypothetical protein IK9_06037 [Bacillus cereus VD166]MBJ8090274.1 hypothetical protein [Bacillus cereus]
MREEVKWFAEQMESKLQENDHKGGWKDCDLQWLVKRLKEEVNELELALKDFPISFNEYSENVIKESADVSNFSMMIADIVNKMCK